MQALRGDGDLCVCVLFDFLQVAPLLPDEATDEVVVSQNFKRDLVSTANRTSSVSGT